MFIQLFCKMNDWILECNDVGMMQITPFLMVSARVANARVFKVWLELKDSTSFFQKDRAIDFVTAFTFCNLKCGIFETICTKRFSRFGYFFSGIIYTLNALHLFYELYIVTLEPIRAAGDSFHSDLIFI